MTRWLVLEPIPVFKGTSKPEDLETQKNIFDEESVDRAVARGEAGEVLSLGGKRYSWRFVQSASDIVDLTKAFGNLECVSAYAWAEIDVPEAREALVALGSDDAVKVWLNGELVHENWIWRPVAMDSDLFPVSLRGGRNQLLVRVQNLRGGWGFCCRVIGPASFRDKLMRFAAGGNCDEISLLVAHGADVNSRTASGLTALHVAQMNGRLGVVQLLLDNGANGDIPRPSQERMVNALFTERLQGDSPGAAVLISQRGSILYEKGFGLANIEKRIPITPETKFRIGSITKQFTAAAILKLQDAGLVELMDPLSKFIPDYPRGSEVTIYHLLTHTSGIHSYTEKPDFLKTVSTEAKPESLIASFKNDKFDFDPGTQWRYNNSGYFLLGYLVDRLSKGSYETYLKESFFDPLGMKNTGVHHRGGELANEAAGYSWAGDKFQKALDWDMSHAGGAGALYSTVTDLHLWNEAVFNGEALSKKGSSSAFTPVTLKNGSPPQNAGGGYGCGWAISSFRGAKEISHGGGLDGFVTYLARYPDHDMTIAVLTNCAPPRNLDPAWLSHEIAQIYLSEDMAGQESYSTDRSVDPGLYDRFAGRYEYPGGAVLEVTKEKDKLFAQMTGQPRFEIFPLSTCEFFWKVVEARIIFVSNDRGEIICAIHRQGGTEIKAPKLAEEAPARIDPAVYDSLVGEYELAPGVTVKVSREADRLFGQLNGQARFEIFPRSNVEFFLRVAKVDIRFLKNGSGKVTGLTYTQGGVEQTGKKIR